MARPERATLGETPGSWSFPTGSTHFKIHELTGDRVRGGEKATADAVFAAAESIYDKLLGVFGKTPPPDGNVNPSMSMTEDVVWEWLQIPMGSTVSADGARIMGSMSDALSGTVTTWDLAAMREP